MIAFFRRASGYSETVPKGKGIFAFYSGSIDDILKIILNHDNGKCYQDSIQEVFRLFQSSFPEKDIIRLADIDFVHQ